MSTTQTTTLAGGCFWCIEAVFDDLQGVLSVESGYSGGTLEDPSYQDICTGTTGHAEVVRIEFDPHLLPFNDLLRIFFSIHDPTSLNRQGADVGTQYRSAIFYHDEAQKQAAEEIIAELEAAALWPNPIVTVVSPLVNYYPAEDYHQEYFANNPNQPYCAAVVAPKVAKFRKQFIERLKK